MDQLFKVVGLGVIPYAKSRRDDDYVDRLNHRTTVAILVCFAVLVSTKQFVGNPISCWMPAHFHKDTHDEYTNRCVAPVYQSTFEFPTGSALSEMITRVKC